MIVQVNCKQCGKRLCDAYEGSRVVIKCSNNKCNKINDITISTIGINEGQRQAFLKIYDKRNTVLSNRGGIGIIK